MHKAFSLTAAILITGGLLVPGAPAQAQREVLPAEEVAALTRELPAAAQAPVSRAFGAYLQSLGANADPRRVTNAVRVYREVQQNPPAADAGFVHYSVPAMSPVMRLPDAYPSDGKYAAEVGMVMAQDEYEPASFVLYPFANQQQVQLAVGELKNAAGVVFPAGQLDLKVVKVWYQNGNAWYSYFQDAGLELVPELLLHDENLVRVDTAQRANYARVGQGQDARHVWISAPRKIDVPFDHYAAGFQDAKTLQPVALHAGEFKQFVLTARTTTATSPGLYRGFISVTSPGQAPRQIPVAVRVLPFQLPHPKANYDVDKDFVVTMMGAWPKIDAAHPAFKPTLANLRAHNILNLGPAVNPATPEAQAAAHVAAMKEAGFRTDYIINGNLPWQGAHDGTPLKHDELRAFKRSAQAWKALYQKHFGHNNAAISLGDEQGAPWVMKTRPAWRILHEEGLKSDLAGHEHIFVKGGHMLDNHATAGSPGEGHKAETWRAVGHGRVGFYANQHTGSENPAFVRRQHGLLGYLSNFDMVNNYEFAYGPWNDLATELYKPMTLAYPTSQGLVDTLAWEGFREGIDDIRYATRLRQLAREAIASGNLDRVYAGRQVSQWFILMDGQAVDLDRVRLEMIEKIAHLTSLANQGK